MLTYQLPGKALEVAAKEWLQYLQNYDEISGFFDKHSTEHTGFVDKTNLTKVCHLSCLLVCVCARAHFASFRGHVGGGSRANNALLSSSILRKHAHRCIQISRYHR